MKILALFLSLLVSLPACTQSSLSECWFRMLGARTRIVEIKLTPPGVKERARVKAKGKALKLTVSVEELRREYAKGKQKTEKPSGKTYKGTGSF